MASSDEQSGTGWLWLLRAIASAIIVIASHHWGYHKGYKRGSLDMRDTVMCVIDRFTAQPIGKGTSDYCKRVAASREERH